MSLVSDFYWKGIPTFRYFEVNSLLMNFSVYTIGVDEVVLSCMM